MSGIEGPFEVTKFCGASVTKIQSTSGWQEQVSTLRVDLVEDKKDRFIPPEAGTPMSFEFGGFKFDGLVQRWDKSRSTSGNPVFSVTLYSPVEILEAVQLILDAYRGVNLLCPNLLNVFGYLEGEGDAFGGSGKNESGISWYKIQSAIQAIQEGGTPFSPGIEYKGHRYMLDMGAIPPVPDFYRLGGGAFLSLSQAIRTVFEDSGYDFIVQLNKAEGSGPHTISFKSRSRLQQQPLGQISAFVEGKENVVSFEEGAELRNDITCGVILGGDEESIIGMFEPGDGSTIWQYWGFQEVPFLIPFGLAGNPPLVESSGFGNDHTAILNAAPLADILYTGGLPVYPCSVFEMRLAMVGFDSWSAFIARKRPEVAEMFGLEVFPSIFGLFGKDQFAANPQSIYADNPDAVSPFTSRFEPEHPMQKLERLCDFVRNQAETYMGKEFVVRIPLFLKYYFEEETYRLLYNLDVSSEGYYPDYLGGWNSGPLGLNYENFNHFMDDNGRFRPFLKFGGPNISYVDLSSRNSTNIIIQGSDIFVPANVENTIIFSPDPSVHVSISEPLFSLPPDPVGGINDIAWLFDVEPEDMYNLLVRHNGEFPVKIHPWPFSPIAAGICLKSNEYTYGPWSKIGVAGKVKIEQNQGLVPWNYGGFETMRAAAEAQLADIGASSQLEESGEVTFPGAPDISLGEQLNGSGPVVTSIDVNIGTQGVTTTYRMRSQTPVYGTFSKQNAERLRRLGTAAQDLRRTMRALFDRIKSANNIIRQSKWAYLQNVSRAVAQEQATNVFHFTMNIDPITGAVLAQGSNQTFAGAIGNSGAHNDELHQSTASMGMEGLLRPFYTGDKTDKMPYYEPPKELGGFTSKDLNPFKAGSDILWASSGDKFQGYYTGRTPPVPEGEEPPPPSDPKVRVMGLRGPMVMVGWGYELSGKPVPNLAEQPASGDMETPPGSGTDEASSSGVLTQDLKDQYIDNYLLKSNKWKAGPIDLRWDKWRKVWSAPGVMFGRCKKNKDNRDVVQLEGLEDEIEIEAYLESRSLEGKKVAIAYDSLKNKWRVISSEC